MRILGGTAAKCIDWQAVFTLTPPHYSLYLCLKCKHSKQCGLNYQDHIAKTQLVDKRV